MGKMKQVWEDQLMNGNEPVMTEIDELLNNNNLDLLQNNKYMDRVDEIVERIIDDIIQHGTTNNVHSDNGVQLSDRKKRRQQATPEPTSQHSDSPLSNKEEKEEDSSDPHHGENYQAD